MATLVTEYKHEEAISHFLSTLPCQCEKCTKSIVESNDTTLIQCLDFIKKGPKGATNTSASERFATALVCLDDVNSTTPPSETSPPSSHPGRDTMVKRYLAATHGDVDKARHLLTTTLVWRRAYGKGMGNDQLRRERMKVVDQYYTLGLLGGGRIQDKNGRSIWIERVGLSDCQVVTNDATVFNNETLEETFIRAHVTM